MLIALTLIALLQPATARADDVYTFVVKKQEEKAKSRWSLQDWLDTKEKMRLMDLWLSMHSPSPYEFFVGGDYQLASSAAGRYNAWEIFGAAYAHIFGLEARREAFLGTSGGDVSRLQGMFDLRAFGFQTQATNLTLQIGLRQQTEAGTDFRSPLAGVSLTLYLGRYFGIDGLYRRYFASTPNSTGAKVSASRFEAGAFIDFKFLRVYGTYFSEPESRVASSTTTELTRSGATVGTKLFF